LYDNYEVILAHLLAVSVLYFLPVIHDENHFFIYLGGFVRLRSSSLILRGVSLFFIMAAAVFIVYQLIQYSISRSNYPSDMTIGGVPVGGLNPQSATQRLLQVYSVPVEIHYNAAVIDLEPGLIGFQINTESMLAAADLQRTGAPFWLGYWDYLWNRHSPARQIPLVATFSEERLRVYLQNEISTRYDQAPISAQPIPGTVNFTPGTSGQSLDVGRAITLIAGALESPDQRVVLLTSQRTAAGRPTLSSLQILLKQIIDQSGFTGIVDLYFLDLQTTDKMQFGFQSGKDISVNPDIAFTASSTIKIPIMVSVYRHFNSKIDDQTGTELKDMIALSNNDASDSLMKSLDETHGPLVVSETMQALGLENTFINGFFYPGAGVLKFFNTPANERTDVNTDPDIYSQTTPADMAMLLEDIYLCAQTGGSSLVAVFPGQIDQAACQQMILFLQEDKLGALIQAGVPEGTIVAHKHGWDIDLTQYSDAGIVYTPGGNYILTIYVYNPGGGNWTTVSPMYAKISRAVYNFFNLPSQ
jgi:beta-lactamase class A